MNMLDINDVFVRMRAAADILPCDLPEGNEVILTEGILFDKIRLRLMYLKQKSTYANLTFSDFNYVTSYEVGDISGNQLLRLLVGILNDESLCNVGNGILLSNGGEYCAAIGVICHSQIEIITLPFSTGVKEQDKCVFLKLFDDVQILRRRTDEKYEKYRKYLSEENIYQLRTEVASRFTEFLTKPLLQSKHIFCHSLQNALTALLMAIARTEIRRYPYCKNRALLNAIPVAASIKFSMDLQQIESMGTLTKVFGEMYVATDGNKESFVVRKARSGAEAAKQILLRSIPNCNGFFAEEDVLKAAEDVKAYYQL